MNPAKASGFITVFQGNPPTAAVEFRPASVINTKLGELLTKRTAELNEELKSLYANDGAPTSGFEPATAVAKSEIMAPASATNLTPVGTPEGAPAGDNKTPVAEVSTPETPTPEAPAPEQTTPAPAPDESSSAPAE